MTVSFSQGQAVANFSGPVASLMYPGDSVSGHGWNGALLRIITGAAEASANAAEVGSVLASVPLAVPAFTAPSGYPSTITAATIAASTILQTGTAGHARLAESADSFGLSTTLRRLLFSVGVGSGDLQLNSLSLIQNGQISVTALSLQMP